MMNEIWIATQNKHKINEFKQMFSKLNIEVKSMLDLDEEIDIEETGSTFEENAIIKAEFLSQFLNKCVIADDSGLVIDALNGEPGIHSARYLGHDTDYMIKNNDLLQRMKNETNRNARFVCAIALATPNKTTEVFVGTFEGEIGTEIKGNHGFGYDPIFYLPKRSCYSAELSDEEKNKISHRGIACQKLMEALNEKI